MKRETTNPIVFIVRIWSEPREVEAAGPEWKGTLENLATGERSYFIDLDGLLEMIDQHLLDAGLDEKKPA